MRIIDNFLNRFTMYVVILGGLIILAFVSLIYSLFGLIFYSPISLISSLAILLIACFVSNYIFAKIFKAPINWESSLITSLILFFIMMPVSKISDIWVYLFAGVLAMGSKYILAVNKRHVFNPAAFALVIIGILGLPQVNWWVGNSYLFPLVLIIGLLFVRKVRKVVMVFVYFVFALFSIGLFTQLNNRELIPTLIEAIISYPIIFLGTVMLIEPLTTPPKRNTQIIYGGIVGILSGAQLHFGPVYSTPELALVIGNIYSYFVSFRRRLNLSFIEKRELSPSIFEFVFSYDKSFKFMPGQYLEWTLGGLKLDIRGVRRFFTIASSPTEDQIKLGIKINKKGSSFKNKLLNLEKGDKIFAGSLSGDFIIPENKNEKLVFIAGGIGVTPFRSILKYLIDKNERRDIIFFFSASDARDLVYKNIFESSEKLGVKIIYILTKNFENITWNGVKGRLTADIVKKEAPDYKERIFYLSGPSNMVDGYKKMLRELGVTPRKIVTDYFPGF